MSRENSGKATAAKMTAEERKARAMKGVEARKLKASLPKTAYKGEINIGDMSMACYVLDDGRRIISENSIQVSFGSTGGKGRQIRSELEKSTGVPVPLFLASKALEPFINKVFTEGYPEAIECVTGDNISKGFDASILPKVCEVWLKAKDAGALQPSQLARAKKAEILMRGLAHIGIVALIDEATGYQEAREKDALAKIFEAFIDNELQDWIKTFPDDYYKELFRLYGMKYPPENGKVKRPGFFGHVTNRVVYKKLAPEILPELKKRAKKLGNKGTRLHQTLTPEKGHPDLLKLVSSVTTIMKLSETKEEFFEKVDKIHPDFNENYNLDL